MRLAPAIVPLRSHGGDHFVVFRGVVNGQAVLADPAFGNRSMPFAAFDSKWKDRLGFVVKVAGKNANRLHASRRDLLRVEDEAARQAMADKLPRPLGDAQLALAFAIDALRAPTPGPLVPIASPDNPNARPPATGFPPSQALAPPSSLAPAPTPVAAPALPGVPPS